MIISVYQDLPFSKCLLCGQQLVEDTNMTDHSFCQKIEIYVAENKETYHLYHYAIWKDYVNIYLPNNIKINYSSFKGEEMIQLTLNQKSIALPVIELDFSDISKLFEKLIKLINFL